MWKCFYKNEDDFLLDRASKYSPHDECALCLEPYRASKCVYLKNCNHVFHESCINEYKYFIKKRGFKFKCPYCE